jgi:plasmid stabilization system protein ParE
MDSLAEYIAADNRTAALKVLDRIERTVENLSHAPTGQGKASGRHL